MSEDTGRRCPRCDCPDGHTQCEHCKICPHAGGNEAQLRPTPLEEARATVESLRHQIRRAREALGPATDTEDVIARVRALHKEEYGCCAECTSVHAVPYPCPTIRALDGETQ